MRTIIVILIMVFCNLTSSGQKTKISYFKESKIKIINFIVDKDPNKLPVVTLTILNNTREDIIFNKISLTLYEFKKHPLSSSSNNDLVSKALTPIAGFDIPIPLQPNTYLFDLRSPIKIVRKDAATICIRLHHNLRGKQIVPSQIGYFKFHLTFLTYDLKGIPSPTIELGNQ